MIAAWDAAVVQSLYGLRSPLGIDFFSLVTNFAGAIIFIGVFVGALIVIERSDRWPYGVGMIVPLCTGLAISEMIRNIVQRARPPVSLHALYEIGYSFPSNHATIAVALYGFLIYAIWKCSPGPIWMRRDALIALCMIVIVLVGFSRIYLGVHYPSDIIAGYIAGFIAALFGARVARTLMRFTG